MLIREHVLHVGRNSSSMVLKFSTWVLEIKNSFESAGRASLINQGLKS